MELITEKIMYEDLKKARKVTTCSLKVEPL